MRGPSPLKNAALALLVLLLVPALVYGLYSLRGNPDDAIAHGQIALADPPPEPSLLGLNDDNTDLPDILELTDIAQVELPDGPTETQNGGPVILTGEEARQAALAGADESQDQNPLQDGPSVSTIPDGIAPSVITINGRPVGDSETEIDLTPPAPTGRLGASQANSPLRAAPIAGLSRSSPFGPIPAPDRNGLTPLKAYAKPFATPQGTEAKTRKVALVVGGLGINAEQTRRAINLLPPQVTLSFAAQSSNLQSWINQARAKGHEVILELPMEPFNFDPASAQGSQYYLRSNVDKSVNIRNLDYLLSRAQGYFAVTNYLGDRFLESGTASDPVLAHLHSAGLGFIHDSIGQNPMLSASLKLNKLPSAKNRGVIDVNPDVDSITQVLNALAGSVNSTDIALGMGFSYPQTIDAIIAWSKELETRDIILVPASATLKVTR